MAHRFSGSFEDLKLLLGSLASQGQWSVDSDTLKQFRHSKNGGIINWYPSTGTIAIQGKESGKMQLEAVVLQALSNIGKDGITSTPPPTPVREETPAGSEPPRETASPSSSEVSSRVNLGNSYSTSELVIGLVGAVGTEIKQVATLLADRLKDSFGYTVVHIHISTDIIPTVASVDTTKKGAGEFDRISKLMDAGNEARQQSNNNSILALGVAAKISQLRKLAVGSGPSPRPRVVYLVSSLKHPEEVSCLREIYSEGFYLIGVHCDQKRRLDYLINSKRLLHDLASKLIDRDEDEHLPHGQRTSDTFHLSDFFVRIDENQDRLKNSIWRILDILFGHPYRTPTFDEYAMFMAFAASLRSADLSRQVGAVIARDHEILSSGANDCPKFGGGQYWPEYDTTTSEVKDYPTGRDYTRGEDSNKVEQQRIIQDILSRLPDGLDKEGIRKALEVSRITDLTEFGRVVHAEMEAILCCGRNGICTRGARLYGTTFPCHNCAKHIVAAGLNRVIYIEPYPKSKAAEFHSDSLSFGYSDSDLVATSMEAPDEKVSFVSFVGVGPRRFFDLFSMRLGSGHQIERKTREGQIVSWNQAASKLRIQMLPCSYLELELLAASQFNVHAVIRSKK